MPQNVAEPVVPLPELPSSALSTPKQASFIAGPAQDRAWDPLASAVLG